MPFVLPNNAFENLEKVREKYQAQKGVDLNVPPSWIGRPTFLGGADVVSRKNQITFSEKMQVVLHRNLLLANEAKTPQEFETQLTAKRAMLAVSFYTFRQLSSGSTLLSIMKSDLGITSTNTPNEAEKEICFLAAQCIINLPNAFKDCNAELEKNNMPPFTQTEWDDFAKYIERKCKKAPTNNAYTNYPFTSVTQPFFGATLGYAGATIGALGGQLITQSAHGLSAKSKLTATLGSAILVTGTLSPTGILLFAPLIAEKLITTYCTITLAHVLGTAMNVLGQGVGIGVGMPLDISYNLLYRAFSLVTSYFVSKESAGLTGLQIIDGNYVCNGIVMEVVYKDQLPTDQVVQTIEVNADGQFKVLGDKAQFKITEQMIQDIIDQLKKPSLAEIVRDKEQQHIPSADAELIAHISTI